MTMRSDQDMDDDDEFADLYKEYTGPVAFTAKPNSEPDKRAPGHEEEKDEIEEEHDPNAVPTDFTSREAKVWEAKSKAIERNWKKRKEEEMICKICGESGHFTQGCPSTLGANRKSQDFFERVAARDPHVRALLTDKVMQRIEKEIGCKLKLEEKFLIVSGKHRLVLAKGVDAVHKVIRGEGDQKGPSGSHRSRSRSPNRSPVGSRFQRSEAHGSYSGHPRDAQQYHQRFNGQDKKFEDRLREDRQKIPRGSPQGRDSIAYLFGNRKELQECLSYYSFREACGKDGARSHSSHSRSPGHIPYSSNSHTSYDSRNHSTPAFRNDGWDTERRSLDMQSSRQVEYSTYSQVLEEIELEYNREFMELARIHDKEEDEENYKHRETVREMRENYMKRLAVIRASHGRLWEEFLQLNAERRQQQAQQLVHSSGFASSYKQHVYHDYFGSAADPSYAGTNVSMDGRVRYPNNSENYSSRSHESFSDFHHQRHEDFGKTCNRY